MRADEEPIVVEETYEASIDRLWQAMTDPRLMPQWFFKEIRDFKPEVGFESRFLVVGEKREFPHVWKVVQVDPPRMISYRWRYGGYPGDSVVTFRLSEEDGATTLRLNHRTTADFPDDIPEFKRESGLAGWKYFLGESLRKFLEKS